MRKLALALCAGTLALTGVACGEEGGGSGGSAGVNALAAAAENATEAGSSRMTMAMEMDVSGQQLSIEGDGAFDYDEQVGEMTMTMSGAGLGAEQSIDMIIEGNYVYMKMPAALGGGGWVRMDVSEMAAAQSQFGQDPSQYLDFLRGASDDIEEVGTEEIDGVSTTHYEATLSFDKILEQAPNEEAADAMRSQLEALGGEVDSIPSEVWIDEDGLPRRMELEMSVEAGGQTADMLITMDLFDYGVDVNVEPPKDYEEVTAPAG